MVTKKSLLIILSIMAMLITPTLFAAQNIEGIQIYQKNLQSSPAHKQKLADDISRYRNADNLWDVLRDEFVLPHYEDNPAVQQKIEWFLNNQDYLLRSATRAAPYLYYILQQVKRRHLPAELVLLPIIESGYNPFSQSPVGAVGIWQLMPSTASGLGVKQDWWYDGRRDVIASTRAALNYLAYLQSFFEGNWLFAIAAYNTGEGNVLSAIKRNIRDGLDTDFWSLPVAQQTKDYVPMLLALATIISHPDEYPIYFPPVRNAPYLAQVDIGSQISLKYAATLAGISYQKMQQLNPGFSRSATSAKGPYKLVLPIETVDQFTQNLSRTPLSKQINWLHYKIKSGDTLASVAKKFDTTPGAIRSLNHLSKNTLRHGTNILIPANNATTQIETRNDVPEVAQENKRTEVVTATTPKYVVSNSKYSKSSNKYTLQPGDTIYMVRPNDTLASITKRFKTSQQAIQIANNLASKNLTPGKQLIIPTHPDAVLASNAANKTLQPGDTVYMVRNGDTVEKIARKFNTTPAALRLANLIDNDSLAEGERLVVPTHLRG